MRRQRRGVRLLALTVGFSLFAAACGGDDDDTAAEDETGEQTEDVVQGGEVVDCNAFSQGPAEHIDPALSTTVSASQVGLALYDGLTEVDYSGDEPVVRGKVAESWESNDDATEWTFTVREDLHFSDGSDVLPSSFVRAWERATDPEFAGDYSYLFSFVDGGQEKLDGAAGTISGVEADDEAMTLTVQMDAPYANFAAVAGFKLFHPMPEATEALTDQTEWETGEMVGNGPFMLESPWVSGNDVVLVPNSEWDGTKYDAELNLPAQPYLDRVTMVVSQDQDTAANAFEAGECDMTTLPSGRVQQFADQYANTLDSPVFGAYFFQINQRDDRLSGPDNRLLRQAISQAIDREEINEAVYEGTRTTATGITPPGIPGFEEGLCDYCSYDPDAAQEAYDEWQAQGNSLEGPLPIQLNADAGHEPVVQIIIDNLAAIGIEAVAEPIPSDTYFGQLAEGACVVCRSGWIADYPTYDNFMFDLFHSSALDGNNYGYTSDAFDELVDEAKQTTDTDAAADLYHQAEQVLLNDDVGTIPINWYRGTIAYNGDKIASLDQRPDMHVVWETMSFTG